MTQLDAWNILYKCAERVFDNEDIVIVKTLTSDISVCPFGKLETLAQTKEHLDYIYRTYYDVFKDGAMDGVGYLFCIDQFYDTHPVTVLTVLYALLIADADIYLIYKRSYNKTKEDEDVIKCLLDELVSSYEKAQTLTVPADLTCFTHEVIEEFVKSHEDVKHIVDIGDFVNFHNKSGFFARIGLRVHLPAAHYVIMNYANEEVSVRDRQILESFGKKCYNGYVDYAGYQSRSNQHPPQYGFDVCDLFETDLTMLARLNEIRHIADRVVTVIFTDKSMEELGYPEELCECCDVYLSKEYNDNILNYDFTQLLK